MWWLYGLCLANQPVGQARHRETPKRVVTRATESGDWRSVAHKRFCELTIAMVTAQAGMAQSPV